MSKILILIISDIHVRSGNDEVLKRSDSIVAAIRNVDREYASVYLAIAGDLAFSGKEDEYLAFWEFVAELKNGLKIALSDGGSSNIESVNIVVVPGNHDCRFDGDQDFVRSTVLANERDLNRIASDPRAVEICLSVQDTFFEMLQIADVPLGQPIGKNNPKIAYEYRYDLPDCSLRFICLNSAWLSTHHEEQGRLYIPVDSVPVHAAADELVVAMVHHPLNWINVDSTWEFRGRLESISDIIITGHEHQATSRTQAYSSGERNTWLEIGSLQQTIDADPSQFTAIIIDSQKRTQKVCNFSWDGTYYRPLPSAAPDGEKDGFGFSWETLQTSRFRGKFSLRPNDKTLSELDEISLPLRTKDKSRFGLFELYVPPHIELVSDDIERRRTKRSGQELVEIILEKQRVMVIGEKESGKTSIARAVYVDAISKGLIPLLIDVDKLKIRPNRVLETVKEAFAEQYDKDQFDIYQQIDRSKCIIIIDNYDRIVSNRSHSGITSQLAQYSDNFLFVADQFIQQRLVLESVTGEPDSLSPMVTYELLPLGHERRSRLIERWFEYDSLLAKDAVAWSHRVESVRNTVDRLVGRDWLPAYPTYILTILQAATSNEAVDQTIGTQGAFYELLIRASLLRGRTQPQYNIATRYLSSLAFGMFNKGSRNLSLDEFERSRYRFSTDTDLSLRDIPTVDDLSEAGLISMSHDEIRFRHKYIYLFFVALGIRDQLADEDTKPVIEGLIKTIGSNHSSSILIFLSHVSKSDFTIEQLIVRAQEIYSDRRPTELGSDVPRFLLNAPKAEPTVFAEPDVVNNRRKYLNDLDDLEADSRATEYDDQDEDSNEFLEAVRTIDVLGQILKNFPASIAPALKIKIVKECFELSRRALADLFDLLQSLEKPFENSLIEMAQKSNPTLTVLAATEQARRFLYGITEFFACSVFSSTAGAIASPEAEPTYRNVLIDNGSIPELIIGLLVEIRTQVQFPVDSTLELCHLTSNNSFAEDVLRKLILAHFYVTKVDPKRRTRVLSALDVRYPQRVAPMGPNSR